MSPSLLSFSLPLLLSATLLGAGCGATHLSSRTSNVERDSGFSGPMAPSIVAAEPACGVVSSPAQGLIFTAQVLDGDSPFLTIRWELDGAPFGTSGLQGSKGSALQALDAADLPGGGSHQMVLVAVDEAGNETRHPWKVYAPGSLPQEDVCALDGEVSL